MKAWCCGGVSFQRAPKKPQAYPHPSKLGASFSSSSAAFASCRFSLACSSFSSTSMASSSVTSFASSSSVAASVRILFRRQKRVLISDVKTQKRRSEF